MATDDEKPFQEILDTLGPLDKLAAWKLLRWWRRAGKEAVITWLTKILYDETAFERYFRMLIFGIGTMITTGVWTIGPKFWWFGQTIQILALLIGAGDKNIPKSEVKATVNDQIDKKLDEVFSDSVMTPKP